MGLLTATGLFGYALYDGDKSFIVIALTAGIASLLLFVISHLGSFSARCPLCMNPVLHTRGCQKHRKARKFFGSFRLRVARDIVFKNKFLCPYCGEPTVCAPRERRG